GRPGDRGAVGRGVVPVPDLLVVRAGPGGQAAQPVVAVPVAAGPGEPRGGPAGDQVVEVVAVRGGRGRATVRLDQRVGGQPAQVVEGVRAGWRAGAEADAGQLAGRRVPVGGGPPGQRVADGLQAARVVVRERG